MRIGEEGVALLVHAEVDHVHRHQRLERARRIVAAQAQLAHVRDVEQRGRLPALPVLGQDAVRVVDRHLVARERHHLGAELDMQIVQRGVPEVGDGHA